ncbi:hypothetical protein J437_LFUL002153 [Ladona fulva]|uniref:Uncharacterized protein n=1 Tax=Ladona fulva TaxID=123851 RepID=A0A8K0JYR5_LADFU|nr:hypothetical protein J437_LFUL002153 [Ladona fulva]
MLDAVDKNNNAATRRSMFSAKTSSSVERVHGVLSMTLRNWSGMVDCSSMFCSVSSGRSRRVTTWRCRKQERSTTRLGALRRGKLLSFGVGKNKTTTSRALLLPSETPSELKERGKESDIAAERSPRRSEGVPNKCEPLLSGPARPMGGGVKCKSQAPGGDHSFGKTPGSPKRPLFLYFPPSCPSTSRTDTTSPLPPPLHSLPRVAKPPRPPLKHRLHDSPPAPPPTPPTPSFFMPLRHSSHHHAFPRCFSFPEVHNLPPRHRSFFISFLEAFFFSLTYPHFLRFIASPFSTANGLSPVPFFLFRAHGSHPVRILSPYLRYGLFVSLSNVLFPSPEPLSATVHPFASYRATSLRVWEFFSHPSPSPFTASHSSFPSSFISHLAVFLYDFTPFF